ncbi:hypothetical protein AB8A21_02430 [Streptomyces sp. BF23-18]|uniref:hypothetical protein n=1 Tax=Streptomyces sp. BF23-18 TaxID=3240282 RepID=UPI0034E49F36
MWRPVSASGEVAFADAAEGGEVSGRRVAGGRGVLFENGDGVLGPHVEHLVVRGSGAGAGRPGTYRWSGLPREAMTCATPDGPSGAVPGM